MYGSFQFLCSPCTHSHFLETKSRQFILSVKEVVFNKRGIYANLQTVPLEEANVSEHITKLLIFIFDLYAKHIVRSKYLFRLNK